MFSIPFVQRSGFCKLTGLLFGIALINSLPPAMRANVPMVEAAVIINCLLIGAFIGLIGLVQMHPVFKWRMHPIFRGGIVAAILHLDFIIYLWPVQKQFWTAFCVAFLFGAILDSVATKFFGEGKTLTVGLFKK